MPQQHTFIALYSGETVCTAKLLTASADPQLVALVRRRLLNSQHRSTVRANSANSQDKKTAEESTK